MNIQKLKDAIENNNWQTMNLAREDLLIIFFQIRI